MSDKTFFYISITAFWCLVFGIFLGSHTSSGTVSLAIRQAMQANSPVEAVEAENGFDVRNARLEDILKELKTVGKVVMASWYGDAFHGKVMANGEVFDMNHYTVASRSIPLGSIVAIENMSNRKIVLAMVTDVGPFVEPRAIDVSYRVAHDLGMVRDGICMVKITILKEG